MMRLVMTITYFSEKTTTKNREKIRFAEFGGWGRNRGFGPEYLPVKATGHHNETRWNISLTYEQHF